MASLATPPGSAPGPAGTLDRWVPKHGSNANAPGPLLSVLIADAQALFAQALGVALGAYDRLQVVGERPVCGPTAIAAVCRHRPDVVVYDYWMLGLDGPTAIREILAAAPGTKVLVTSWFHSSAHIRAALDAGAAGFLPKSLGLASVAEALRRVGAGEPLVFAEQLAGLVENLENRWDRAVRRAEKLASLTPRESEVLQALAEGTPAPELAQQLSISVGTLRNHIHHILAKTGTRSKAEAIDLAREARFFSRRGLGASREQVNERTDDHLAPRSTRGPQRHRAIGDVSVLVADTQLLFAEALAAALSRHPGVVVVPVLPTRAPEAIEAVVTCRPDVVVYDLHLRDMESAGALRALSRWAPNTRVVLLSWYHGLPKVRKALAAAPDVVVPKSATLDELCDAVHRAAQNDECSHAAEVAHVVELLDGGRQGDAAVQRLLTLTPREIQVLHLLAKGSGIKEVATALYLSAGTVKNLSHRLMRKLGVRTHPEAQAMARHAGFLS